MNADKNGIGIEAAKLSRLHGIESRNSYMWNYIQKKYELQDIKYTKELIKLEIRNKTFPAYTWQEILWEHAVEFFGEKIEKCDECGSSGGRLYQDYYGCKNEKCLGEIDTIMMGWQDASLRILKELQKENYEEAEKLFIDNCILLNN